MPVFIFIVEQSDFVMKIGKMQDKGDAGLCGLSGVLSLYAKIRE